MNHNTKMELRQLRERNAALLEALKLCVQLAEKPRTVDALRELPDGWGEPVSRAEAVRLARAAIRRAEGK